MDWLTLLRSKRIPNDSDSDDDGLSDGEEVLNSTYELVSGSYTWDQAREEAISEEVILQLLPRQMSGIRF